ncbi:hypothetical protein SAICODRAFT_166758 [Saitoella complicata NRRL Y-17804]|uniref:uncharacterized protein n=1 Tax=Saitoella complicata (strain BCRC 22490 / CBS 7301 / JCM 7358 / NBRC 10748 / NRRL Y-17804) TaxID=698492 RepID=UPI000866A266|nr:uncharacterized protein SAICODRAFT_166758 [Saitoella complicata NRRL Y-17804]ODQ50674.1 hypothetical protein SAICODRAFT_166758 [Saitoella complicata NRRL Y-17804]
MFRSIIPVALRSIRVARPFQAVAVARVARPFSTTFVRLNEYSESAPVQAESAATKNNKLFVTNIPFTASEEELLSILGASEIKLFRDQYGRSRGYSRFFLVVLFKVTNCGCTVSPLPSTSP